MPLQTTYDNQTCSVASTLEIVGGRWTMLILRELFMGVHRFDEMRSDLGIARNVLQTRLELLAEHGLIERRLYQPHPPRHEYRLTDRGLELWPALIALMQWGDRHVFGGEDPPVELEHRGCGGGVDGHMICTRCGARLGPRDVWAIPGPGAGPEHPLRRRAGHAAS